MATCQYIYTKSDVMDEHIGEKCPYRAVPTEKLCKMCIFRINCEDLVSAHFKQMREKLQIGRFYVCDDEWISPLYDFVMTYDGDFHLRGMAIKEKVKYMVTDYDEEVNPIQREVEDENYTGDIREATEEEKMKARDLGIVVN